MDSYTRAAIHAPRLTGAPSLADRLTDAALVAAAVVFAAWHYADMVRHVASILR